MHPPPPGLHATGVSLSGVHRLTLEPDSVLLEVRDSLVGLFQPEEEIFWEEVRAVYTWTEPDWTSIGASSAFVLGLMALVAFILSLSQSDPLSYLVLLGCGGLLLGFIVAMNTWVVPRRCLRIVGDEREILFHSTERALEGRLLTRLGLSSDQR